MIDNKNKFVESLLDSNGIKYTLSPEDAALIYESIKAGDIHGVTLTDSKECFSCEKEFEPEEHNDREQGYFCDECLTDRR